MVRPTYRPIFIILGYYGTLLRLEHEAKSYSVIYHHGDRFFAMAHRNRSLPSPIHCSIYASNTHTRDYVKPTSSETNRGPIV